MVEGLRAVASLPIRWGKWSGHGGASGLEVGRVRVPLGVVGSSGEARPNVTADAAALCLKAGNAVVLRAARGLNQHRHRQSLDPGRWEDGSALDAIQLIESTDREAGRQ